MSQQNTSNNNYDRDADGFLRDPSTWNQALAISIAKEEGIKLTAAHWAIINFLRQFYTETKISPSMRAITNAIKTGLISSVTNADYFARSGTTTDSMSKHIEPNVISATQQETLQATSIYLYQLFPKGPATQATKIAGLPKPTRCI